MFEAKNQKLLTRSQFARRLVSNLALAGGVLAAGLSIGVMGYHFIAGFGWLDAILEASMILTGMGPVGILTTPAAKIFAAVYALFSGLLFISVIAITLTPVVHRILHKFHMDDEDLKENPRGRNR